MMMRLELLQRSFESGKPSQPWLRYSFEQKAPNFVMCPLLKIPKGFLSNVEKTSLKVKGVETFHINLQVWLKPLKSKTIYLLVKPA